MPWTWRARHSPRRKGAAHERPPLPRPLQKGQIPLKSRSANYLDECTVLPYTSAMIIWSVKHRGLLRLIEDDDSRELRPELVKRLRNILAVLIVAADMDAVSGPPGWRVHQLRGNRAGTWSISVSGNWRITFDIKKGEICNLNLEDYH
jgi:proteic killer suppression protein